ncbi:MAG: HupE/UreJ family protein [Pseudomonadota bacterium]
MKIDRPIRHGWWVAGLVLLTLALDAQAHGFRPAELEIDEVGAGIFLVRWAPNDAAEATEFVGIAPLRLHLPEHCERTRFIGDSTADYFRLDCGAESLLGGCLRVQGFASSNAQAIAKLRLRGGSARSRLLTYGNDTWCLDSPRGWMDSASSYFSAGLSHILDGADHLLFLLTLVLIFRRTTLRLALITAFTVGHSLSLALATLGWLTPPMAAIEILIAWTVAFAAYEACQGLDHDTSAPSSITQRLPWLVTGGFGFVHGFGFASALREIGFGDGGELVLPLLSFNLGVEAGQVLVLAVVLLAEFALRRLPLAPDDGRRLARVGAVAIGSIAIYWVLERGADLLLTV